MREIPLPVEAVAGDARHRDVRAEVFAVIPQARARLGTRLFWRLVLFAARFPPLLRVLQRGRQQRGQNEE